MLYFIVNRTARTGKGSDTWKEVKRYLRSEGVPYKAYETGYEGHAMELAGKISRRREEDICIVVVGGDGTLNEVLNGITNFDGVRLGLIPAGSGNDFARGLKLPKNPLENLKNIIAAVKNNTYVPIDLGGVSFDAHKDMRLFGISAGIGMDAIVCKRALHSPLKKLLNKIGLGKLTYIFLTLHTLFSMETVDINIQFDDGNVRDMKKVIFLAAMNMRAEGGGVPMAPDATAMDGLLSFGSASGIPKWRTFFYLPALVAAKQQKIRGFTVEDAVMARLYLSKPMVLHADGEYCGDVTEVTFFCLPKKLKLLNR